LDVTRGLRVPRVTPALKTFYVPSESLAVVLAAPRFLRSYILARIA